MFDEDVEAKSYVNIPVSRDFMRGKYRRTYMLLLLHYTNLKPMQYQLFIIDLLRHTFTFVLNERNSINVSRIEKEQLWKILGRAENLPNSNVYAFHIKRLEVHHAFLLKARNHFALFVHLEIFFKWQRWNAKRWNECIELSAVRVRVI